MFVWQRMACGETRAGAGGAGKGRKRGRTACETAAGGTPGVPGPGDTCLRPQSQLLFEAVPWLYVLYLFVTHHPSQRDGGRGGEGGVAAVL